MLLYHLGIGAGCARGRPPLPRRAALHARRPGAAGAALVRRGRPDLPRDRPAAARPARVRHQPRPGRARVAVDLRLRPAADVRAPRRVDDAHRHLGQGQGRRHLAGGRRPCHSARRRAGRGAVADPLVDLRQGRGRLGRRPRYGGARGPSRARARPADVVRRDAAAGAALPPVRRPQPAARRSRLREDRRLPRPDPARPVLLRDRAARAHRRPARRRRDPRPRLRRRFAGVVFPGETIRVPAGARATGSSHRRRSPAATGTARPSSPTAC